MDALENLLSIPRSYALSDGSALHKFARQEGLSEDQLQAIASGELKKHGNPALSACALFMGGTVALCMGAVLLLFSLLSHAGVNPLAGVVFAVAGLPLIGRGWQNRKAAALPAAVLRARANSLDRDGISILKDRPDLADCRDTHYFLGLLQSPPSK